MNQDTSLPRLRALETTPTEHEGQQVIVLSDPLRLSEASLIIPMGLVPVLQRMDGTRTAGQIRQECLAELNFDIPEENIKDALALLDEAHFLDGAGFDAWRRSVVFDYLAAPARPSLFAGKSYEADPAALRAQLGGFFTEEGGPGLPGTEEGGGSSRNGALAGAPLRGLIAPHIDFGRGGATFASSYRAVAERAEADVFAVLGTIHAPTLGMYSLTRKAFETPLGALDVDGDFVDGLTSRFHEDLFRDEFAQRGEHSIEFQAVFLRYLYPEAGAAPEAHPEPRPGSRPIKFVPILVGSFGEFVAAGRSPAGDERVEGFVSALRETTAELKAAGRKVCYLASVDLAHVGPQFGDERPVDAAQLRALEEADRASLDAVCRGDAEAFYWSVATDGDARNVCGLAPVYTMLRAMESARGEKSTRGEVLRYSQWPDPNGTVTFCSVALT